MDFDPLAQITRHCTAFYDAATDQLDATVPSCPGWNMADLVAHLTGVHWSWATIVEDLRNERLTEDAAPPRVADAELVAAGRVQADRLVRVLAAADPSASCWTWAQQQDVAFVLRHQVQEAAVHHWDAANAMGAAWSMDPAAAADAVSEFLTFSVSTDAANYGAEEGTAPLAGSFSLRATDTGDAWTVTDGKSPGALAWSSGGEGPAVEAVAADLLLWLYRRAEVGTGGVDPTVLARFRALSYTD
jgi:uncharacterized protein (TIGR03083 family)